MMAKEVYVDLKDYAFKTISPRFYADSATMSFKPQVKNPVVGEFYFEAHRDNKLGRAKFPQFVSYTNDVEIKDFTLDVNFVGGFAVKGNKISSKSICGGGSYIEAFNDGVKKFKAISSLPFNLKDSTVTNLGASIIIYDEPDSITHPYVSLRFNSGKKLLEARRDRGDYKVAKFIHSDINLSLIHISEPTRPY